MPTCQADATSPYLHSDGHFLTHCHMLASRPPSSLLLSSFWTSGVTVSLRPSVRLHSVWLLFSQPDSSDGGSTRQQTASVTGTLAIQLVSPPLTKIILPFFFSSPLYPAPTTSKRRKEKSTMRWPPLTM